MFVLTSAFNNYWKNDIRWCTMVFGNGKTKHAEKYTATVEICDFVFIYGLVQFVVWLRLKDTI